MRPKVKKIFRIGFFFFLLAQLAGLVRFFLMDDRSVFFEEKNQSGVVLIISAADAYRFHQMGIPFLDTRTREEYELGHIPSALLWEEIEKNPAVFLSAMQRDSLVLYCSSGCESAMHVAEFLKNRTRVHLFVLFGGFEAWLAEGGDYDSE